VVYVWTGLRTVAFTNDPSPNDQFQDVGEFVEVSVNVTVNGVVPDSGVSEMVEVSVTEEVNGAVPDSGVPMKFATGAGALTVI